MTNIAAAVGLIAFIVIGSLIVAGFSPIFGSLHKDSIAANVSNSTHNTTYEQGVVVAQGFMGLTEGIVMVGLILLIVLVILLMFTL